jgi:lipoate-protein ligase A
MIAWKFFFSRSTNPYENLAIESELMEMESDEHIFFIYSNSPCVVIGKNQNIYQEVNPQYLCEHQIPLVRRSSGGGTVYHDLGGVNISFITPNNSKWVSQWEFFFNPIILYLKSHGIASEVNSRNSLLANGKKVGGSAQKVGRKRMISHASLLFYTNLLALENVLKSDKNIQSQAAQSVRSTVQNLGEFSIFKQNLEELFFQIKHIYEESWGFMSDYNSTISRSSVSEKQNNLQHEDWIIGRNPAFTYPINEQSFVVSTGRGMLTEVRLGPASYPIHVELWKGGKTMFHPELGTVLVNYLKSLQEKWAITLEFTE